MNFLKRFFNWIFGIKKKSEPQHKNITERAVELLQEQKQKNNSDEPVKIDLSGKNKGFFKKKERVVMMKNNRLHIQYNGNSGYNGHNISKKNFRTGITDWFTGSMYKDRIDSMRCTRLERAEQIVGQIQRYCIDSAIFKDAEGNEFKLI